MNLKRKLLDVQVLEEELVDGKYLLKIVNNMDEPAIIDSYFFKILLKRILNLKEKSACEAVILCFDGSFSGIRMDDLFEQAAERTDFKRRMFEISDLIVQIRQHPKYLIGLINNSCLSAAFSLLLICDKRFGYGDLIEVGFPEASYGVFPGFGSAIFLKNYIGFEDAFYMLTQGNLVSLEEALRLQILEEVSTDLTSSIASIQEFLNRYPNKLLPDAECGQHSAKQFNESSLPFKVNLNIPAHVACISVFKSGEFLGERELMTIDLVQSEYVLNCKETKAMVRTLHFGVNQAINLKKYPSICAFEGKKISVIGAGMMGSGIAYEVAKAGYEVCLKDISVEAAELGKETIAKIARKHAGKSEANLLHAQSLLERIKVANELDSLHHSDLIIEAVYEHAASKTALIQETSSFLTANGFYASNTTSLPIKKLANASLDASRFIGLHFFSPVDRMPLVEIIRAEQTSAHTLGKALSFVRSLSKIPIVVNDSPAFFTSRIFFAYLMEGILMVLEGLPVDYIDKLAKEAGFSSGPLRVLDEISLELMAQVLSQLPSLNSSQERVLAYLNSLIKSGRKGRKSTKGFYEYAEDLSILKAWEDPHVETLKMVPLKIFTKYRLLHAVSLESFRCLEEGVIEDPIDGDIGSILGLGFAVQTGGVFSHIDLIGIQNFVNDCNEFLGYGEHWKVPALLKKLAFDEFKFYTDFKSNWSKDLIKL
ncbi:3-hydroxyacyl-CoA dehydrogenase NAD-binding domain-containing protein [Sphingobacterium sp. HJSM2_6]|uniref:3-hydroxyacyl-CoA dehydrogenase NAD-binding domain-containing protein n=1 Tax=Sphingobacterium sp. HJSM2_6 TaxID=3366264 RepID=UPI003BC4C743